MVGRPRKENPVGIVEYFLSNKNLIKLEGDSNSYPLASNVIEKSNFEKYPLLKGNKVEYQVKDGTVTYLRKIASDKTFAQPTQSAPQTTQTTNDNVKELIVYAVATNKKVVKFLENKDEGWFDIAENLQSQDYTKLGLVAHTKVHVVLDGKTVVSVKTDTPEVVKEQPDLPKAEEPKKPYTNSSDTYEVKRLKQQIEYLNNEKQKSIEIQSCINNASEVVGRISASLENKPTSQKIIEMIDIIARANYQLIQELKK